MRRGLKRVLVLALVFAMVLTGIRVDGLQVQASETTYTQVTSIEDVKAGGKFVLVANNNGTYYAANVSVSGKPAATEVTVTDGTITGTDLPVWNVLPSGDGISLSDGASFLSYGTTGTDFKSSASAYTWNVTESFQLTASGAARGFAYSISAGKFGAYATSNASKSDYIFNIMIFKLEGGVADQPAEITLSTIAEAKAASSGTACKVKGTVVMVDGKNVVVQDSTGGINLYFNTAPSNIAIGDVVQATGTRAAYNGLEQLSGVTEFTKEGTAELSTNTVTIANITADQSTALLESTRVYIKNAVIGEIDTTGNTTLTQDGNTINIYKMPEMDTLTAGDTVSLYAVISDYNGYQLRVLSASDVTKGTDDGISTIAEAKRAATGTADITVQGTVVMADGRNIYVQDRTGGIDLYFDAAPNNINVGDVIKGTGVRASYKGLEELSGLTSDSYTIVSTGATLPGKTVTIANITADQNTGALESTRVYIENAVIGAINTDGNTTLTQDGNTINIYRIPAMEKVTEGDTVNLYAIVSDFNGYQLRVADAADVTWIADGDDGSGDGDDDDVTSDVYDPITDADFTDDIISLADAYTTSETTVTVIGQLAYQYGNNGNLNSAVLQDVIDGDIVGLQVYNALSAYKVGDVLKVTGTLGEYGGVKQITNPTVEKLRSDTSFAPQQLTVAQLKAGGDAYLSEYVQIKAATLGEYSTNNTAITDATGSINIYRSVAFPDGIAAGDTVNVYGVFSKYSNTYQLRNGLAENSFANPNVYKVDESVEVKVASWDGTADLTNTSTVYGDLEASNDFKDTDATITVSTGAALGLSNTSNGVTSYYMGSKGLTADGYYQLQIPAAKYGNLTMDFQMRGSNTGAKYFNILYSTDGVNYTKANSINYTYKTTDWSSGTPVSTTEERTNQERLEVTTAYMDYSVTFPAEVNNADILYVRVQVEGDTSIKGATIATGGINRFIDIQVTGNPVVDDSICGFVKTTPAAGEVEANTALTLTSSTSGATIYYSVNGGNYAVYNESAKPVLSTLPATVKTYAVKDGVKDSVTVTYEFTQIKCATPTISPNGGAVKAGKEVSISCLTEGAKIRYSLDGGSTWEDYTGKITLSTLPATITAYAYKDNCLNSEEKNASFTERENENYNLYFGQMHSHTDYSDGAGSCEEAFAYGRDEAEQIDYLFVTDHSNSFDNDTNATITDGSVSTEWIKAHQLAEEYTTDDFVALYGYEMTWSGGAPGHMNTYNTEGFLSRNMSDYVNGSKASLPNYYEAVKTVTDSINQFNHPGTTFGDFYDFDHYDEEIDGLITLIEVGNGEGAIGSSGYFPSYEYYTRALDKGWHVAPTNNQDNHKGKWGDANTARTVVLADTLTEDNIYDAMRNMRVYATEDNDLEIQYTLNDEVMGTILSDTPDSVNIVVDVKDPTDASVGTVDVIVDGGIVAASKSVSASSGTVTFQLPANYAYYYVRITQPDKDIAVTAPVWVSEVEAVGISGVSTETDLAISGETIDITGTIYNNEQETFHITSIEFSIDDKVIKSVDLAASDLETLAFGETKSYTFNYTYNGFGKTDIVLTLKGTINGVEKVYSGKMNLEFISPSMVTRVIVDGTHSNDYVNGYYGGNVGNFSALAAAENMQVQVVDTEITAEMLETCSVLVISAPAKKEGTYNNASYDVCHFEDEFIALVADYVDAGGTVVLCGLADYQDSANGQTTTEMNKLLEAMGATTRYNSDELVDDVENGGQNYRLYFDDFNMESEYMKGIVEGQTYSAYSGCGILVGEKAEALVYGHETTYSIDSKTHGGNYVEQPKGSLVALAHEQIGDADIFVGGTVFISDFEVKLEMDNASDLPYANRNILLNILAANKKQPEITTIANVRKAGMGEMFAIEGYVTAGTAVEANTFFDTIYIQDETAGITLFPYAEAGLQLGQKLRVIGYVDEYQGDKELQISNCEILDEVKVIEPAKVTTAQAADYEANGGRLVQVTGKITRVEYGADATDLKYIYVMDESGKEAVVFTDGYIGSSTGVDKSLEYAKEGNTISAVGLVYKNPDGTVIRVRDRAEIVLVTENTGNTGGTGDSGTGDIGGTGDGSTGNIGGTGDGGTGDIGGTDSNNEITGNLGSETITLKGENLLQNGWVEAYHKQESKEVEKVQKIIENYLKKQTTVNKIAVLEINLYAADGTRITEPNGYITVTIPIPEALRKADKSKLVVYRIDEVQGAIRLPDPDTSVPGQISFRTNHFSTFAIVEQEDASVGKPGSPNTGEDMTDILMMLAIAATGIFAGAAVYRKKLANR